MFRSARRQAAPAGSALKIRAFLLQSFAFMNSQSLPRRAAAKLLSNLPTLATQNVTIGLDGFVDEIVSVVETRKSIDKFSRIPTLSAFGDHVARCAGQSSNAELVVSRIKLGGNGPIMANALAAFGTQVTYIGNVGYPALHPAFKELADRATVLSIAEPGHTDALEFDDGKLMLGKLTPLNEVTWENLLARIGREKFTEAISRSNLVGLQNWTMIPFMSDIWQHVLDEICPSLPPRAGRLIFFDLADPQKREPHDIAGALKLIAKFQRHFETFLGLNEKESFLIGGVLGYDRPHQGEEAVRQIAQFIHDVLQISGVIVHPRSYAVAASKGGVTLAHGPFTPKPLISTGAGDHFNAGFCLGKLMSADNDLALQLGVGASGYYVRTGKSPSATELADFLQSL
jgi:sugar/nucleoside kinase (ribokinase family)